MRAMFRKIYCIGPVVLLFLVVASGLVEADGQPAPPASNRITINLSAGVPNFVGNAAATDPAAALPQSNWWYENNQDSTNFAAANYVETAASASATGISCGSNLSAPNWAQVGIPNDANIWRTFINQASGGGQGSLCGQNNWYRLHFKIDPTYANSKIMVEIEGAHTGAQVYINGTLLAGISAVAADAEASHVVGFIPFIVDLTPYLKADGATDNVLAIRVSRGSSWYEGPDFSEVFRFGQAMAGLFRPVKMFITNKVHIPVNVYSNQKTWGTYVATVSEVPSSTSTEVASSAVIQVETNVVNETTASQQVTLTTQIVDGEGNVVAAASPVTQTVAPMTPGNFPSTATPMFNQQITVTNPTLWYPNNCIYGKPYLYTVNHIVSVNGTVVDVAQSPLGIRTITWDTNYPYFNGHAMYLWGGSGRYDYPGLGSSVPEEQQWRDLAQFAAGGGNIWRPGHSTSSEEFVAAADAYGVMIDQPSGDNEEAFASPTADTVTLKEELHRDMIVRDRSHPSILDWESNNGTMEESIGKALLSIDSTWDPVSTRVAADRTPDPVNGTILGCTLEGCEVGIKNQYPNNPAWGAEYWGTGTARGLAWNYELAFVAPFLDNWQKGRTANAFGMAQWYFADTPGETGQYVEAGTSTTAPGNSNAVRSLGASAVDQNRFPKLLYYVYEAAWTPFSIKPVVELAGHWNLSGSVQVNAFSNCPSVKLLLNGVQQGAIKTPNPWNSNDESNQTETTTLIPFQTSWTVPWASGTIQAQCLDSSGTVVATDSRTTAGAESKIVLSVVPELTKPSGASFQVTANGSDAAFVTATIEDANGNWEPLAADNITFSVTGPATYQGGTQQYVSTNTNAFSNANSTYVGGIPDAFYHSPGDPELQVEGGLTRIALRSQFTPGTVTVTATAPGLASGSASFTIVPVPDPRSTTTSSCTAVPSAPTGLTATAPSSSVINLSWTAVTPPTNCTVGFYNVYRSTTSGFSPSASTLVASDVTATSYTDTGLSSPTTYYYKVEAVDADGSSAASAQASATTPVCAAVPSAPTGLTASAASASAIGLNWTAVTPPASCTINSYSVYRSTTSGFAPSTATLVANNVPTASYSDSGLTASTTYYYVVEAVDTEGSSPASAQASATTKANSTPTYIIAINAGGAAVSPFAADEDFTGGAEAGTTATISTTGVANPAPQAVYQSQRYGNFTYTIPGLTAGASYPVVLYFDEFYWTKTGQRVFNVSINGTQVLTNFDIIAASGAADTAIDETFQATANTSGQIVITFTAVTDNAEVNGIAVLAPTTSGCTSVPPTGPTGLTAADISSSVINLSWTAAPANPPCTITSYSVYRSTTSGFAPSASTLVASNVTGTTYSDTGLAASTTYYYVVEAFDSFGPSAASAQASATTTGGGSTTEAPYGGTPAAIPGTVQAENYDTGGQGVAYNVTSTNGSGNSYRSDGVDLEATTDTGGGYDMGWTTAGQWFKYTVNVTTAGTYTVTLRVAAVGAVTDAFHVTNSSGTNLSGSVNVPATGGWQTWENVTATITLPAGVQTLTLNQDTAGWNINYMSFASSTSPQTVLVLINCGGGATGSWLADTDFTGGFEAATANTITTSAVTNPAPQAVYQSNRYNAPSYTIGGLTAGASYIVRLHFAETYWTAAGKRTFNVSINGAQVLTNFDIFATAGGEYIANVQQFTATANSSGQIVITSTNVVDNAQFNGIEIDQ
jgi:hypothetical protein